MRSARRASVRSAGCEALRAEQTVDTPHPHVVAGREAFGNNGKFTRREPRQAVAKGTIYSKVTMKKNRTGFPVECETHCWAFGF